MSAQGAGLRPISRTSPLALTNRAILVGVVMLLAAPSALFAFGLKPFPATCVLAGCLGGLVIVAKSPRGQGALDASIDGRAAAVCLALAFAVLLLGGETHLLFATNDWLIRDAVLADLVRSPGPVVYRVDGADFWLRAPLGMYMAPALVGRSLGLTAAHVALLVQNALLLGGALYLLTRAGATWLHIAVLLGFSGMSALGFALGSALIDYPGFATLKTPIRDWALDAWNPYFQYSSSLTQFFWAPNHALPGWSLAALVLLHARRALDTASVGVALAGAVFWSPLAVIPAALWLAFAVARDWRRELTAPRLWLGALAGVCFAPLVVYIVAAAGGVNHGLGPQNARFGVVYALFIGVNLAFALVVAPNLRLVSENLRAPFLFNLGLLALLPFVEFGPSNDLASRGSITALVVCAFVFAETMRQPEMRGTPRFRLGVAICAVAALSPLFEIARALTNPRFPIGECSLMEAHNALGGKGAPENYTAPVGAIPAWLFNAAGASPLEIDRRRCWPHIGAGATS